MARPKKPVAQAKRYLRNKADGWIFDWNEILAENPKCEEVTEEEAYPERFLKPEMAKKIKNPIDLTTYVPEPDTTPPELAKDAASRGFQAKLDHIARK